MEGDDGGNGSPEEKGGEVPALPASSPALPACLPVLGESPGMDTERGERKVLGGVRVPE